MTHQPKNWATRTGNELPTHDTADVIASAVAAGFPELDSLLPEILDAEKWELFHAVKSYSTTRYMMALVQDGTANFTNQNAQEEGHLFSLIMNACKGLTADSSNAFNKLKTQVDQSIGASLGRTPEPARVIN